jgi:hypothetical protein
VCLVNDVDGDVCIAINPKDDGTADMILPINDKTLDVMGKTTSDAIREAIRGEKDHFFLDGKALVAIINASMKKEVQYLEELKENITKMIGILNSDIKTNDRKAQEVADAWSNSALPVNIEMPSGANGSNVHITVNNEE